MVCLTTKYYSALNSNKLQSMVGLRKPECISLTLTLTLTKYVKIACYVIPTEHSRKGRTTERRKIRSWEMGNGWSLL